MQSTERLRFSRKDTKKFFKTLNNRVNEYFKQNEIEKTGNWKLYLKTFVMFLLLIAPYVLVLTLSISLWIKLLLYVVMGLGMAGVGMNVMHDGNHGSFSKYQCINNFMGSSIYFLQEMYLTGKFNIIFYITPTQIFMDMMRILKLEEYSAFQNILNGCHIIDSNTSILFFYMVY